MCGLFGALAPHVLSFKEQEFVRRLATMSTPRGLDGTGCLLASARKRRTAVYAEEVTPSELMYNHIGNIPELGKKCPVNLMMGHNRAATVGSTGKDNLHPYEMDDLIGAHNGTILKYKREGQTLNPKGYSDSYFLFEDIQKRGLDAVIKELAWGAYALTIYDKKKNHLIFLRNNERPLWFCRNKQGSIFWASERIFLTFVAHHGGFTDDLPKDPFFELPENTVWTWDFNTAKWLDPYHLKHEPTVYRAPPAPATTTDAREGWYSRRRDHLAQKRDDSPLVEAEEKPTVIHLPALPMGTGAEAGPKLHDIMKFKRYKGYKGLHLTMELVTKLLQAGDAIHGIPGRIEDKVWWFGPRDWVFDKDKDHEMIRTYYAPGPEDYYEGRVVVHATQPKEVACG